MFYYISFIVWRNVCKKEWSETVRKALDGLAGSGLSEDGPVRAADLRAAPPAPVLRQPAREEPEHVSRAGTLQQQEDTFNSQTPSSRGNQPSVQR